MTLSNRDYNKIQFYMMSQSKSYFLDDKINV